MPRVHAGLLAALLTLAAAPLAALAAEPGVCQAHVVLFTPAGVNPPAGYQRRIEDIVDYTEAFFLRELKRWGHDKAVSPFRRAADGRVPVTLVKGKQKIGQYKPVSVRAEVMDHLRATNRITAQRQVWWILVYPGPPPAQFPSFLGGFGDQIGGWAVCTLDMKAGPLPPAAPLGAGLPETLKLKGMIHELGHGFRLPHIGPLDRDRLGNTLMGPTHINYRRVVTKPEPRVYLCEAEAAMLALHPAFRGVPYPTGPMPKPDVQDLRYAADPAANTITVTGRVRANGKHHPVYALVADEFDARPGEYWTKTWVAKVDPDGSFKVTITEPAESNGTLKTWFLFDSGAQTGNGAQHSRESGIAKAYSYGGGKWAFR